MIMQELIDGENKDVASFHMTVIESAVFVLALNYDIPYIAMSELVGQDQKGPKCMRTCTVPSAIERNFLFPRCMTQ